MSEDAVRGHYTAWKKSQKELAEREAKGQPPRPSVQQ